MKIIDDLSLNQVRVLGALLEKEQATPEYYPLTVNALIAACNQKSNRDPVMQLTETEVVEGLDSLAKDTLVWRSDGTRAERWRQSISRRLELDPEEKAILTLLMLRGPQTTGELRSRSPRLHAFGSLGEIEDALRRLTVEGRELVVELARRPGQKENRWTHRMAGESGGDETEHAVAPVVPGQARSPTGLAERVAALEIQVAELSAAVERMESGSEPS